MPGKFFGQFFPTECAIPWGPPILSHFLGANELPLRQGPGHRPGHLDAPNGAARSRAQENWPQVLSVSGQSSRYPTSWIKFRLSRQFAPRNVPFRGDPEFHFTSSGQMNCPCGKVRAVRPGRLDAPDGAARLRAQENRPQVLSVSGQSSRYPTSWIKFRLSRQFSLTFTQVSR